MVERKGLEGRDLWTSPSRSLNSHFDDGGSAPLEQRGCKAWPPENYLLGGAKSLLGLLRALRVLGKERLHLFYCCIINKELVKYLRLLRKSSKGPSRLHTRLGWKETEGLWGLTYIPHPTMAGVSGQEPSSAPSAGKGAPWPKSPEMSSGCSIPGCCSRNCAGRGPQAGLGGPMLLFPQAQGSLNLSQGLGSNRGCRDGSWRCKTALPRSHKKPKL